MTESYDNAAELLAEMTGRPPSDFDASEYDIPDFDDQKVTLKDTDEADR